MGVCLSCHRRKGRGSEKKKCEVQLCQSLAPLHECVGECGKVLSEPRAASRRVSEESADKNSINRASVVTSTTCNTTPPCISLNTRVYSLHSSLSSADQSSDINSCSGTFHCDNTLCNGTRKRTISSFNQNIDSFNHFFSDNSNGKHALTLSNGHSVVSISNINKKDNSCTNKCDSFLTDLKSSSRDSMTMANTISNMKMTNPIKGLVSKRRRRYVDRGFDLDLTYITNNIIAMGFPAEKVEAIYRNNIEDVSRFLEETHKDHYKIYNLCSERSYDHNKFHNRVSVYPFDDHNPPKIDLIRSFCEDMHKWLTADQKNVAAVHCKAGKGRTGTMICCYLLHEGKCETAADALNLYGQIRTHDRKGVTIPSQRRYVEYYAALLEMIDKECVSGQSLTTPIGFYPPPALVILKLLMKPPPALNGGQSTLEFCVSEVNHSSQKVSLGSHYVRKGSTSICMQPNKCTPLAGDIKVEVYNTKPKIKMRKEKLFHFWFNTFFVTHEINAVREEKMDQSGKVVTTFTLTFDKWQLDDAHKDKTHKTYSPDFMVQLLVQCVPKESYTGLSGAQRRSPPSPPSHSHSSSAEEEEEEDSEDSLEPEEGWDSAVMDGGESGGPALLGRYRLLSEPDLDLEAPTQQPRTPVDPMLQA